MNDYDREEVWSFLNHHGFDHFFRKMQGQPVGRTIEDPRYAKLIFIYNLAADALEDYVKPEDA